MHVLNNINIMPVVDCNYLCCLKSFFHATFYFYPYFTTFHMEILYFFTLIQLFDSFSYFTHLDFSLQNKKKVYIKYIKYNVLL